VLLVGSPSVQPMDKTKLLTLGKEAVQAVQSLGLRSSTHHAAIVEQLANQPEQTQDVLASIVRHQTLLDELNIIATSFRRRLYEIEVHSVDEFVEGIAKLCKESRFGNCGEQAVLAAKFLKDKKGVTNFAIVGMDLVEPKELEHYAKERRNILKAPWKDHTFLVLGIDPNAELTQPETWGRNAIIVDPWMGLVASVPDGLEQMRKFFSASSQAQMFFHHWLDDVDLPFKDHDSGYDWSNQVRAQTLQLPEHQQTPPKRLFVIG
jgi:hypothetical protein